MNGNRLWSTYFGTSGFDSNVQGAETVSVSGNDVYITGASFGNSPSIGTPNTYQQNPETNGGFNYYFAKFNVNGALQWCSYYGGTSTLDKAMNIFVDGPQLYLYGSTNASNGINTPNCWQNQIINPQNSVWYAYTSFLAKFTLKESLSTGETELQDLVLADNPNNGSFTIGGSVLEKGKFKISIFELSGRMVYEKNMSNSRLQRFDLQSQLITGSYLIKISESSGTITKTFKMIVKK